ncbi:MAG: hypothetical protein HY721_03800 [Planctomycetes bacterium]|nr:hypothetical protein [Planctomycetota bacterium]
MTATQGSQSHRRGPLEELRFWLRAARLVGAILLEGLYTILQLALFLVLGRRVRGRIHAVILGRSHRRNDWNALRPIL